MLLEACATGSASSAAALPLHMDAEQMLRIDWSPLLVELMNGNVEPDIRATMFHARLARTIAAVAARARETQSFRAVGLTGGVFQNRRLTELATDELTRAGFEVWLSERVPCNDGGLAFGQLVEATASAMR